MIDINELRAAVEAAGLNAISREEVLELLDRLEAAEKERDALRAKIEAMEKQEPVAWAATDETCRIVEALSFNQSRRFDTPLYALPGAQGEKMFAWLKRIFDRSADPVHSCDLYRDKEAGSCVHVDGPLCNFPECSMLDDYRQQKEKRND